VTCDICGHPESSHTPAPFRIDRVLRKPCDCGQCSDFAPFQGYFGPPPVIEQESA
jgi:hypothetical protein